MELRICALLSFPLLDFSRHTVLTYQYYSCSIFESLYIFCLSSVCENFKESEKCYLGSFLKCVYPLDGQSARCVKIFWRTKRFVIKIGSNSFIFRKMVRYSLWSVRHTSCNFMLVSVYFWRVELTWHHHPVMWLFYWPCVLRLYLFIWCYYRNFLHAS